MLLERVQVERLGGDCFFRLVVLFVSLSFCQLVCSATVRRWTVTHFSRLLPVYVYTCIVYLHTEAILVDAKGVVLTQGFAVWVFAFFAGGTVVFVAADEG